MREARRLGTKARTGAALAGILLLTIVCAGPAAARDPATAPVPSWWLHSRSTGYAFQTEDADGVELDRFGAYQEFDGNLWGLAGGWLSVRASGRFADDLSLAERTTDRSRLYVGHIETRPGARWTARLGRQFLQEGVTGLTLDGLWFSARPSRKIEARLWAGARAPLDRGFEAGDLGDETAAGARILANPHPMLRVSASGAYRERGGVVASRPVGLEGTLTPLPRLRATGRATYDMEREGWQRAEALVQWQRLPGCPVFSAQIVDRRRAVDAASWFARFEDIERVRIGRFSIRQELPSGFGGQIEYVGAFVDERTSARIGGAALFPLGCVGYSVRIGDAGEESRWYGDLSWRARPWLRVGGGATFATYALLENAPSSEERDLTTLFARLRFEPRDGTAFFLEAQSLDNPHYEEDIRVLAGLDLTMGRGTGRFGLDRGGWMR
jgi:hypothetical protein